MLQPARSRRRRVERRRVAALEEPQEGQDEENCNDQYSEPVRDRGSEAPKPWSLRPVWRDPSDHG